MTAVEVISFYRHNIPAGWTEASDATCAAMLERMPPPPTITVRTGPATSPEPLDAHGFELLERQTRLTVFTPGENGTPDGSIDGVGIALLRRGDRKFVVFDQPDFACGPPDVDSEATAFDQ